MPLALRKTRTNGKPSYGCTSLYKDFAYVGGYHHLHHPIVRKERKIWAIQDSLRPITTLRMLAKKQNLSNQLFCTGKEW